MKSLLVLSCLVALAFGQEEPMCRCGAFVSMPDAEVEVLDFPPIELEDCSEEARCAERCTAEWEEITGDGDLCTPLPEGGNVAQQMCNNFGQNGDGNLDPHSVFLYFEVCGGPWMFDGQVSQQELECRDSEALLEC